MENFIKISKKYFKVYLIIFFNKLFIIIKNNY